MSDASGSQQPVMWAEAELPREPQRPARLQPVNRNQLLWHAVDVEKLVGPDHLVRAIWELVGQLDLTGYTAEVRSVEGVAGRPAYDPRLLISLWIYAYSQKVGWAREVARRCEYDPAFQWLTGMEVVNYHTLADFRVQHEKALDELFAQLLGVLSSEGLISLERVVHDGTKVKASASGNSFHREKTLRGHLEAARERVREMGDPRQEESSRRAAARERAAHEKVERLERALKEMEKVQAAPEARAADCRNCVFRQQCCPGAQGRRIVRSENVPVVAAYLAKMRSEAARALYRLRAPMAEFSNLWLKTKLGLRQFGVRGLRKVRCEVLWACLTYNIQQWFRLRWKVRLMPAQA